MKQVDEKCMRVLAKDMSTKAAVATSPLPLLYITAIYLEEEED